MSQTCNMDEVIDSRDIIERIEELQQEKQDLIDAVEDAKEAYEYHDSEDTKSTPEWDDLVKAERALVLWEDSPDAEELAILEELAKECQYCSDWEHGATLVRDTYFTAYAKEMLEDCGDLPRDLPWYVAIDWEETADNIKQDYSEVDYDGATYYIRSC